MSAFGIILIILGGGAIGYGIHQNNSLEAQLSSLFSRGSTNPGTIWIVAGGIAAAIGLILLIVGLTQKSNKKPKEKCPHCGGEINEGDTFCGHCGKTIPVVSVPTPEKEPEAKCPYCGGEILAGDTFCGSCGKPVTITPPTSRTCPNCGKEVDADAAFCSACGGKISSDPTPDPMPTPAVKTDPSKSPWSVPDDLG